MKKFSFRFYYVTLNTVDNCSLDARKTQNPAQINGIKKTLSAYHGHPIELTTKNEVINCLVLVDVHIPQRHSKARRTE